MYLLQVLLWLLTMLSAFDAVAIRPRSGPQRLVRCPPEFETVVVPLQAPDQPVLTVGPGVHLQTTHFQSNSELQLDSATGQLMFKDSASQSVDRRFSGPHVLLCTDSVSGRLITFSLFIRLAQTGQDSKPPSGTPTVPTDAANSTPTDVSSTARVTDATPTAAQTACPAEAGVFGSHFKDPLTVGLAIVASLLLLISIVLAVALTITSRRSLRASRSVRGMKGSIYNVPPARGSADPLFGQTKQPGFLNL